MAPSLAVEALQELPSGSTVLDPMCGSGTVLLAAAKEGFETIGFDVDPLAVLLAQVATSGIRGRSVLRAAERLIEMTDGTPVGVPPWIEADQETLEFTRFWFGEDQRSYLQRLSIQLAPLGGRTSDALRVALSRTIITKDRGASLARDVSHSRPHKVADETNYDVRAGFWNAARKVASWLDDNPVASKARVKLGDCRVLPPRLSNSIDLVITSPPYLNAIDYLRGHRLALVWLGHQVPRLRAIRSASVGTERGLDEPGPRIRQIAASSVRVKDLQPQQQRMMFRYCTDLARMTDEVARVLRPNAEAVFVVGNSTLRGVFVSNSEALKTAGRQSGLVPVSETERELPSQHRYLPPPTANGTSLDKRMNTETVLRLRRAA